MILALDHLLVMSPAQILGIKSHTQLFPKDLLEVKRVWRKLAMQFHPDRNGGDVEANSAFAHLKGLYEKAVEQIEQGIWLGVNSISFEGKKSRIQFDYLKESMVQDFGTKYIGRGRIIYKTTDSNLDLCKVWVQNSAKILKNAPPKSMDKGTYLEAQAEVVPVVVELEGDEVLVIVTKNPEYLCASHILQATGPLHPRHVTWILSRLYTLSCLMQVADVPNLSISTDSLFVNPRNHLVILTEGWQYAESFKEKALACPRRLTRLCPDLSLDGVPKPKHVLLQIKALGRELLGDPIGVNLGKIPDMPKELAKWLNDSNVASSCIKEYEHWKKLRETLFGKRMFFPWNLTEGDVYK